MDPFVFWWVSVQVFLPGLDLEYYKRKCIAGFFTTLQRTTEKKEGVLSYLSSTDIQVFLLSYSPRPV